MTQQPLTNFEIQELIKQIAENFQKNEGSLEFVIGEALSKYILIPKHNTNG